MRMWSMLLTALRGGLNETGEAAIDSQALRILDQEVRDATGELSQSKIGLANILAQQKHAEQVAMKLEHSIAQYEGYAKEALAKEDESLALEIAQKLANMENERSSQRELASQYKKNAGALRSAMQSAEKNIIRLKQQVDTVKATESVQRAQSVVSERYAGANSGFRSAMDSLEKIKKRQALDQAEMDAARDVSESEQSDALDEKLKAAGILSSSSDAQKVLARLKKSQGV